ncbi:glycosyltransferase [Arenimonas fontis]|uniref:Glycosyltransferase n=1 Tax=Arenimonas fontis TaxID=2608255 RepID=A0A5B2ZAC7_9GAMM|nr:glycosyltransferase [Arenimonas fontis]KAA2284885.1 glycosyltransferase [Arenimonas fontis]
MEAPPAWLSAFRYRIGALRSLTLRGWLSLRSRGLAATWRRFLERRALARQPLPALASRLVFPAAEGLPPLPAPERPLASIVVPVYNQLALTLGCLRALAASGDATPFEVIVVDDASGDDSPHVLPRVPGLRYHRNADNLGFIGACNAGAALARGEFLVFLNNDTTVQPGWLDALLDTFRRHPDTGLAGSRLVYPDGRLQEAGGIVFRDGSCWSYGRFDEPEHPRYSHVREADYCSGAALAIRRALFERLGGFDHHYAPAYYEDTDLAMRVRQAGLKLRYQPASLVVHHEGASAGTDPGRGMKAHQRSNREKFLARWRDELAGHPAADADPHRAARRHSRHRVLVLDACTPTPDRDSGSVRMTAVLRLLLEEGCSVAFLPENQAHDGDCTRALQALGVEAWWQPALGTLPDWLRRHGPELDMVIASRHYVLAPVLPLLRTYAPQARLVFDTVDLHYLRERREAELAGDQARLRAAERTRRAELALVAAADETWVVSPVEAELLRREAPKARVRVLSNILEMPAHEVPDWDGRAGLLFVGSYRHPPNVDAAVWMAEEVLPYLRGHDAGLMLHLVGPDAPPRVQALGELPGVRVHGFVPNLQPLLDGCRLSVAPLRYGAGVKGKINQALAHGLPVVATSCAIEGMHLVPGEDVLVADDAGGLAAAILRAYDDPALWRRLSAAGRENTRRHFSPEAARAVLRESLAELPPRRR